MLVKPSGTRCKAAAAAAQPFIRVRTRRLQRMRVSASANSRLIALDFDGVVCDSVGESSLSAFKAAAIQWPEIFKTPEAEAVKPQLVEQMRAVRPVVETGYENVVQIRCLYEGTSVDEMLQSWHVLLPKKMDEWQLDRSEVRPGSCIHCPVMSAARTPL
eukprot:GHRR01035436.1.p1 GENE.GHRR01035436.1~~GHRR01035436.1.p1  ORF type:complete len:159 (+),score=49.21 GHRR01035436.1:393-869(+)